MKIYTSVQLFSICLILITGTVKIKRRNAHFCCKNEGRLMQVSGYDRPYFDTTSSELLKHSLENSPVFCMWKHNCTLKNIRKEMKGWFKTHMRCLKNETNIYDLVSNETSQKWSQEREILSLDRAIVVRSQKNFPWNYDYVDNHSRHVLEFKTEQKHIYKSKLAVRVLWSEINVNDRLFIQYGETLENITPEFGQQDINITKLQSITLQFQRKSSNHLNSHKGFLLCMEIMDLVDQNKTACDAVLETVTVKRFSKGEKKKNKKGKKNEKRKKRKERGKKKEKREKKRRRKGKIGKAGRKDRRRRKKERENKGKIRGIII